MQKTGLKNAKDFAIKNVKIAMKSKEMANLSKFLKEAKEEQDRWY